MKKFLFICLCATTFTASFTNCKNNNKNYQTDTDTQMTYVQSDDKEMNDAIAKAKANFGQFEKALAENSKKKKYENLIIKQGFTSNEGKIEHMWIINITSRNNELEGILGNSPSLSSTLKQGDKVVVYKDQISDWAFTDIETGGIHGAYTMQVLRKHMSAEEGADFDKEWGTNFVD